MSDLEDRDHLAAALETFYSKREITDAWGDWTSYARHGGDVPVGSARRRRAAIRDRALDKSTPAEGRAILTAGPPGAGKTTYLDDHVDTEGFAHLDADAFKDELLLLAHAAGELDDWIGQDLAVTGERVLLRELAGYVHAESTLIQNDVFARTIAERRNLVLHGTLTSRGRAAELADALLAAGYTSLMFIDVENPLKVCVERTRSRWWAERQQDSELGARYVPVPALESAYSPSDHQTSNAGPEVLRAYTAGRNPWGRISYRLVRDGQVADEGSNENPDTP